MRTDSKVAHGTAAWFEMVGALMVDAALQAGMAPDAQCSLVERYVDGTAVGGGLVQGLRLDIVGGLPSFRYGVGPHERADVTIEVTTHASRRLNTVAGADPAFPALWLHLQATGDVKVVGDLARLGAWFGSVHDRIVARTC